MKRSSYRSGNAAMQGFQLGQRLDGVRVADYARDLSPARGVRGLALRAGLGLHGSGGQKLAGFHDLGAGEKRAVVGACIKTEELQHGGFAELADGGRRGSFASARAADIDGASCDGSGFRLGHGLLRWLTVGPSSHVTSDTSTTAGRPVPPGRMTLPAYVLQLLTNATEPASALSGEQAGSTHTPADEE